MQVWISIEEIIHKKEIPEVPEQMLVCVCVCACVCVRVCVRVCAKFLNVLFAE